MASPGLVRGPGASALPSTSLPAVRASQTPREPALQLVGLVVEAGYPAGASASRRPGRLNLKISIYVLGDEFTGSSVEGVLRTVDYMNSRDASGAKRVRIHGIGFPTLFSQAGQSEFPETTTVRFAMLMRALCERNAGAFVGLNSLDP